MKKSIYKITNIINNKIYIGQSVNIERRFSEHMHYKSQSDYKDKILYNAFDKYGLECFKFEVIENDIENYNEREKYWIKYYNCNANAENGYGYNMTDGGDEPPLKNGIDSPFTQHQKEDSDKVKDLLLNSSFSCKEIAKLTNYDKSAVTRINFGRMWYDENLSYPLRRDNDPEFKNERAKSIKDDLINSRLTQKEIAEKYGVGRTTVTAINRGQNFYSNQINYPIRKENCQKKPILMLDKDTNELLKEFPSIAEAEKQLGHARSSSIQFCLKGKTHTAYGYKWKYKI